MMNIGFDPSDLGFDLGPTAAAGPGEGSGAARERGRDLVAGSLESQVLYGIWGDGAPITIVNSPPGGGKTTRIVEIVAYLKERSDMKIIIATFTRRAAYDIAERLGKELGLDDNDKEQVVLSVNGMEPPKFVATRSEPGQNLPIVRTLASCKTSKEPPVCDLMVIDEAYQVKFADVVLAADRAEQLLMVGDPGQIGPVVTADVSMFHGRPAGPHLPAPVVMEPLTHTRTYSINETFRLGQETVDIIAPLYDFEFKSSRPDRYLTDEDGERVSEIFPMKVPVSASMDAADTMLRVAEYAAGLVGVKMMEEIDGEMVERELAEEDIAVVVAHNSQSQTIRAMLRSQHIEGITVGTADKMQGGQWPAVVALDPFVGYISAGAHQLSTGRLCVMASRHTAHLTWVHDGGWVDALNDPEIDQKEAELGRIVRERLTAA